MLFNLRDDSVERLQRKDAKSTFPAKDDPNKPEMHQDDR